MRCRPFPSVVGLSIALLAACSDSPSSVAGPSTQGTPPITAPAAGQPVPPPAADEPVFNASTQKLLFQDSFDSYATFSDAVANGWRCSNGSTTEDVTTNPAGACQIVSGMNGTGKAIRLVYDGIANSAGQEAHAWDRQIGDNLAGMPGHTFYVSFNVRITPGAGITLDSPGHNIQIKWLELWNHTGGDRAQFNTQWSLCVNNIPNTLWAFSGNSAANTKCKAQQVRGPWANQGASQWHRVTYKYVTQSPGSYLNYAGVGGARDGVAQMWYDGTLIVAVGPGYCGVAVPGAANVNGYTGQAPHWCETQDQDQMYVQDYVSLMTLGSVNSSNLWPWTIDYDDMTVWRDP